MIAINRAGYHYLYIPNGSSLAYAIRDAESEVRDWMRENTFYPRLQTYMNYLPNDQTAYIRIRFRNEEDRAMFMLRWSPDEQHKAKGYGEVDCDKYDRKLPKDSNTRRYGTKLRCYYATKRNFAGWFVAWKHTTPHDKVEFASRKKKLVMAWCKRHSDW